MNVCFYLNKITVLSTRIDSWVNFNKFFHFFRQLQKRVGFFFIRQFLPRFAVLIVPLNLNECSLLTYFGRTDESTFLLQLLWLAIVSCLSKDFPSEFLVKWKQTHIRTGIRMLIQIVRLAINWHGEDEYWTLLVISNIELFLLYFPSVTINLLPNREKLRLTKNL